jgi:hypothetical protein
MRELRNWMELVESQTVLYHITTAENAASIKRTGFRRSVTGEARPGVYLIDNPEALTAEKFGDGVILGVHVAVPVLPIKDGMGSIGCCPGLRRSTAGRKRSLSMITPRTSLTAESATWA